MLKSLLLVARETFVLLRRDKIFVPALAMGVATTALAYLATDWSLEAVAKIMYDVGTFGFQLTGSMVAIVWGAKTLADSRQEGYVEVQLAAPIGRASWLLGKYLGLSGCLMLLALLLIGIWQVGLLAGNLGTMGRVDLQAFLLLGLGWLVIAALALLMASLAGLGIALFGTVALWLAGLTAPLIAKSLSPDTSPTARLVATGVARFWDLQQFNVGEATANRQLIPLPELAARGTYGLLLIASLLTLACFALGRRDLT